MFTKTNGIMPGQVTPENDKGVVTGQGNNPQNTTNVSAEFKSKVIAVCSRTKDAMGGFYVNRGIGIEAIFAVIMLAVFVTARVFQ
jgi:hypothetical protein